MGAAVAQDSQKVIVQVVRLVPCGGVVFYASVPGNSATSTWCGTSRTDRKILEPLGEFSTPATEEYLARAVRDKAVTQPARGGDLFYG